jgi:Restriction endonuclease
VAKDRKARKAGAENKRAAKKVSRAKRERTRAQRKKVYEQRHATSNWKEFQDVVARIERQLAPQSARVKSPDKILDAITNKPREVDASIRLPAGSSEILITIECRRRGRKDDVRWIEELAAKRHSIGAHQTIAVSNAGFSAAARVKANVFAIELRRLRDVTDEEIASWAKTLELTTADGIFRSGELTLSAGTFPGDDKLAVPKALRAIMEGDPDTIAVYRYADNAPFSKQEIEAFVMEANSRNPEFLKAQTGDKLVLWVRYPEEPIFYVCVGDAKAPVVAIGVGGTIVRTTIKTTPISRVMEYATIEKSIVQIAQFNVEGKVGVVEVYKHM